MEKSQVSGSSKIQTLGSTSSQGNQFLDALDICYGVAEFDGSEIDVRRWKEQQKSFGFDEREVLVCFDKCLVEWVYSRICLLYAKIKENAVFNIQIGDRLLLSEVCDIKEQCELFLTTIDEEPAVLHEVYEKLQEALQRMVVIMPCFILQ